MDIFNSNHLRDGLKRPIKNINKRLENLHLIKNNQQLLRDHLVLWSYALLMTLVVISSLFFGLLAGRPIFTFPVLFIVSMVTLNISIIYLRPSQTGLGIKCIKKLKKQYEWIKYSLLNSTKVTIIESSYAIATFGTRYLAQIKKYKSFTPKIQSSEKSGDEINEVLEIAENLFDLISSGGCGGGACGGGCGGGCGGCWGGCGG